MAGFVQGRISSLPLSEPDRFTSLHRPKHPIFFEDGDDKFDGKVVPIFEAATKQSKGSRTDYIPWATCFCTIPRPKMDELVAAHAFTRTFKSRRGLHKAPPTHHHINPV